MLNRDRLKAFLREKSVPATYQDLADAVGVSKKTVLTWTSGRAQPNADNLSRMANYLGCSVDYLLGRVDQPGALSPGIPPRVLAIAERLAKLPERGQNVILALAEGEK